MEIYDPKTGHVKQVVDECITPYRPNCKGCEYSIDPKLRDGGCGLSYKPFLDEKLKQIDKMQDAYAVVTEALAAIIARQNIH